MRIISGKYKGRIIKMPRGIRPTQNKVRKALFDILGDVTGLFLLELFAGSGAVGIEALSQGAKAVVFVEQDRQCVRIIEHNLSAIDISNSQVIQLDSLEAIKRLSQKSKKFDIIFLDPPYYQGLIPRPLHKLNNRGSGLAGTVLGDSLVPRTSDKLSTSVSGSASDSQEQSLSKKTLQSLAAYDILAPYGFVVAQHFKKDDLPRSMGDLILFKQKRYSDSILSFYKKYCQ